MQKTNRNTTGVRRIRIWAADYALVCHLIVTLLAGFWSVLVDRPGLIVFLALLLLTNLVVWSEWRHA